MVNTNSNDYKRRHRMIGKLDITFNGNIVSAPISTTCEGETASLVLEKLFSEVDYPREMQDSITHISIVISKRIVEQG